MEVPEISEGIVDIKGAAREPGNRSKFAVASNDSDIDPVGACVGMKGSRVQNVVQELRGEKIDIIAWHVDAAKFVCNALAPAEISRVIIDEENRLMEVIVPDEFLPVAIGKGGQNVRLASKLTGWHLDVKSETLYSQAMKDGYDSLVALPGVGISLADALYEKGFFSAEEIGNTSIEDLIRIRGIGEEKATKLIKAAKDSLASLGEENERSKATISEETTDDDELSEGSDVQESSEQDIINEKYANEKALQSDNTETNKDL
jgi:N utilization substance protein A